MTAPGAHRGPFSFQALRGPTRPGGLGDADVQSNLHPGHPTAQLHR